MRTARTGAGRARSSHGAAATRSRASACSTSSSPSSSSRDGSSETVRLPSPSLHSRLMLTCYGALDDLRQILKRLRLGPGTHVPHSARSTTPHTVDQLLSTLIRQGFLDRTRAGEPGKGKRGRGGGGGASQANGSAAEEQWEWRWGPRAHAEVGERAVGAFVAEFMVDAERRGKGEGGSEEEDADVDVDAEGLGRGAEWRKRVDKVFAGVERAAAGAALQDVK